MKQYLFAALCLSGCSAKLVEEKNQIFTLEYSTGSSSTMKDIYSFAFEKKARDICKGSDYEILEKSYQPSTLNSCKGLLNDSNFYWVIRCHNSIAQARK